jgi:hypothetical protein
MLLRNVGKSLTTRRHIIEDSNLQFGCGLGNVHNLFQRSVDNVMLV